MMFGSQTDEDTAWRIADKALSQAQMIAAHHAADVGHAGESTAWAV
jgi:hypothetical protein